MTIKFPELEGVEFYLCGGAVRDILLGLKPKDLDFVMITNLTYDEVVEKIKKIGRVFLTKPEFLTIRCKMQNQIFDLVFPRKEDTYNDFRHPDDVERVKTLEEDAKRRDFTVNAMYMDKGGEIIDFMGGKEDLKNRIIKTCGKPDERFNEDALRILRAIRFSIQLDLLVESDTWDSILRNREKLKNISTDRIRDEINKMFLINPIETFSALEVFGLMGIIKEKELNFQLTSKKL